MKILRNLFGHDKPKTSDLKLAASLHQLALLNFEKGNYAQAEPLFRQALQFYRALMGEMHPYVATVLNDWALLYRDTGNYIQAGLLHDQALLIYRATQGEGHRNVAASLHNLGRLYRKMGDYTQAEKHFRQALDIVRTDESEGYFLYAAILNHLAALYHNMGNYAQAEPLFRQALQIRRDTLGQNHPDFGETVFNLAELYRDMGNYAQAEPLFRQALDIVYMTQGEAHPNVASILNLLALLYVDTGNYAQAEPLFRQALQIRRDTLGQNHPDFAANLNNLAIVYRRMGNYAQAEPLFRQALGIVRTAAGEGLPGFADVLNNLASIYVDMGNYAQAEPLFRQALQIRRDTLGQNHPAVANSLDGLAVLHVATGRPTEAITKLREATAITNQLIAQVFSVGSECQRMAFLATLRTERSACLTLVTQQLSHSVTAVQFALDLVLRRKAIGAAALAAQRDAVLGGRYPALVPKLQQWRMLRMQMGQKLFAGPGSEDPATYQRRWIEWNSQLEQLEADLAREIPEMNLVQHLQAADRAAVGNALPIGSALIEFIRYDVFDFHAVRARGEPQWQPARYAAFVLPARAPDTVQLIDLGDAEQIDSLVATFRRSVTGEAVGPAASGVMSSRATQHVAPGSIAPDTLRSAILETMQTLPAPPAERVTSESTRDVTRARDQRQEKDMRVVGSALRTVLWDPLLPALGSCTRLFLAPDGELTRLPFEVLPLADGRSLIDAYQFSYLSVGRDVLSVGQVRRRQPGPPLIAADPKFDLGVPPERPPGVPFRRLAGMREEGEEIARYLGVQPVTDGDVLETRLKTDRSPAILHLATHGFFLPDPPRDPNLEAQALAVTDGAVDGLGRLAGRQFSNPLLRAGLALAGANGWLQGDSLPPEAEDGILTAEDVTGIDLLDTELVVLSACETALGVVHASEGVYGLRRSFVLAGAKTLVMSLWKVPDQQTKELMVDFYRRILRGDARAEALREAQRALKRRYPHPRDWGAFICQGDPEPMPLGTIPATTTPEAREEPRTEPSSATAESAVRVETIDATAAASESRTCPRCRSEVSAAWNFCTMCGARLGTGER